MHGPAPLARASAAFFVASTANPSPALHPLKPSQDIQLRLQTLHPPRNCPSYPLKVSTEPTAPSIALNQLIAVRNLINQSLDVVDISRWTGDPHDANFIAGQLRLLLDLVQEARQTLKGGDDIAGKWWENPIDENVRPHGPLMRSTPILTL
jgi:hypothetical protein